MKDAPTMAEVPSQRFKMRFEATNDLCMFLNACAERAISLSNFESDRMDVIAFDADAPFLEIKEILEQIPECHVMVETFALIADFTGHR